MTDTTIADRRLHPGTMALAILKGLPQTLLIFPAILTAASDIGWRYFLPVAAASILLSALVRWIAWRCFRYGVGSSELVIEQGLLQRSRRTIPFARIQDVDFEQGPLHRIFGLVRLRVETGGQGADEGVLDSVSAGEAERLRMAVREGRAGAIPAERDAGATTATPLFAMSIGRVLLFGLFNFSLLWIAGIFAALQTVSNWLPFDFYDVGAWMGLVEHNLAGRVTPGAIVGILLLATILGLASGVVTTLARDFGFRLTLEPAGFRRESGLLTRREVLIPRTRIQLALLRSGPIRRAFGWHGLQLQTLGASEAGGGGGLQDAAPFARADEISPIVSAIGGLRLAGSAPLARVSRRHMWKGVAPVTIVALLLVIVATLFKPVLIFTIFAVPLLVAIAVAERRAHLYAFDGDLLFIQAGYWRRTLAIVPVGNIQTLSVKRSWPQRLFGLATLIFDTAGAANWGGAVIHDIRDDLAEALMLAVMERNRNGRV